MTMIPGPLHYQFMIEMPDQFTWDYLEEGARDLARCDRKEIVDKTHKMLSQ